MFHRNFKQIRERLLKLGKLLKVQTRLSRFLWTLVRPKFFKEHIFACALALSSLVHLSAYIWVETTLAVDKAQAFGLNEEDLDVYTEYIKLALTAIYPISKHWQLSGKLAKHIRDSLTTLRPKLYSKLKDFCRN